MLGARNQEPGGHPEEKVAGERRQETGDRRQKAGGRRQEAGGRRQEAGGWRQEAGGWSQEAGGRARGRGQSAAPHTPGPPDLLVESLSNVDLKRSQMTSIGFSEFQHAPFRKGWLFKMNRLFWAAA